MTESEWSWLGVRLATADEVESIGHDPGNFDTGGVPWWRTEVDYADDAFLVLDDRAIADRIESELRDVGVARVVSLSGAAGWPEVEIFAPFGALMTFLASHHDDDRIATLSPTEFEDEATLAAYEPVE